MLLLSQSISETLLEPVKQHIESHSTIILYNLPLFNGKVATKHNMRMRYWLVRDTRGFAIGPVASQADAAEVLIVHVVGDVLQILQMCADQHVPQGDEITVLQVLHCNQPRVINFRNKQCVGQLHKANSHRTN